MKQVSARSRLGTLAALEGDEFTTEVEAEIDVLTAELRSLDKKILAADLSDPSGEPQVVDTQDGDPQRLALRSRCNVSSYLMSALHGRALVGAEAELNQELNLGAGKVPLELFEAGPEMRARAPELRTDMVSPSPTTGTGVTVEPVHPSIFARSVLPRLGVALPTVGSGAFSTMTVSTDLTAAAQTKGDAAMSSAAVLTPQTTGNHRVSARLSLTEEDILLVGVGNFESILRQNLMLALSDRLDHLGLTGDGVAPNPEGLFPQLTDPTDPTAVATWTAFVEAAAGGIDGGPWAESLMAIRLLVNAETMRLAETTFQAGSGNDTPGEMSAAAYLRAQIGGFFASARMPDTASLIAGAILYRAGTMGLEGVDAMTTATCPVWNYLSIDDPYSDSASATHHVTMHAFIGDVLVTQPDAYSRVDFKVS